MKATLLYSFLILISTTIVQGQDKSALHGIWQNSDFGYQMTIMLNPDGSGEFDGEVIRYTLQGNQLKMVVEGISSTYTYALNGNSLTLSGGDIDGAILFLRSGARNSSQIAASPLPDQPTHSTPPAGSPLSADKNELIGMWSANGENIEFKNNGECLYRGNTYKYTATAENLTLIAVDGSVTFGYKVNGTNLTMTGPAGQVVFTKGAPAATANSNSGEKRVAMELVGQWCWINVNATNSGGSSSSRCINLNADGTYTYNSERSMSVNTEAFYGGTNSQSSDQGTWYLQGDRIFYNSQSTGEGSYRLEKRNHPKNVGDPMIVLDGEAYVTSTYRQPWR